MPHKAWSAKPERQYAHINDMSARQRGLTGRSSMNKAQLEQALTQ